MSVEEEHSSELKAESRESKVQSKSLSSGLRRPMKAPPQATLSPNGERTLNLRAYYRLSTVDCQLFFRNDASSSQINACTIGSSASSSWLAGPKNPTRPSTRKTTRSASLRANFMS